jgi:hypothetical protein
LSGRASGAQGCLPTDDNAQALRNYALRLATDGSADMDSTRTRYGLVMVAASEVQIVTDKPTCASAARKFHHAVGEKGKADRLVYVVRIGTRYIVTDPDEHMGEFSVHVVFDSKFKQLASFAG